MKRKKTKPGKKRPVPRKRRDNPPLPSRELLLRLFAPGSLSGPLP
jgi:hypothetical protein